MYGIFMVNTSYSAHFEWIFLACAILEVMQRKQEGEKKRASGLASASRWRRFPVLATKVVDIVDIVPGKRPCIGPCGPAGPVLAQRTCCDYSASDERIKMRFFHSDHIFRIWFPFSHWTDLSFIWIRFSIWKRNPSGWQVTGMHFLCSDFKSH